MRLALYLIEILHQTTTTSAVVILRESCILLKFYIKPQQLNLFSNIFNVVSYWNSTSNHNSNNVYALFTKLYLIEILHQTTTLATAILFPRCCILLKFYIKPQQTFFASKIEHGCILLKFYIKPQHGGRRRAASQRCILLKFYIKPQRRASYWLIKCYLRAVCHYKNTIGCSDEASLMHFPYFKERK